MLLIKIKGRLHIDDNSEDRKLIKSVLDIINPPSEQHPEKEPGSAERFNRNKSVEDQPKIVLHIDDDPEDREMVQEAINSIDPSFIVHEAPNGKSGIEFLNKAKSAGNLPCLIILDVNMPELNGFETYNEIKKDEVLKDLPVVIFTTTDFFKRNQRTGNEHLPIFIKSDSIKEFADTIRKILTHCKG